MASPPSHFPLHGGLLRGYDISGVQPRGRWVGDCPRSGSLGSRLQEGDPGGYNRVLENGYLIWRGSPEEGPITAAVSEAGSSTSPIAFRTRPTVPSARKPVLHGGKTKFEMCEARNSSVENSPQSYSIYMKESWWQFLKTEKSPGHLCDTINNKLGEKHIFWNYQWLKHVRRETELTFYSLYGKDFPKNYKILFLHRGHQNEMPENVGGKVLWKCTKKSPQICYCSGFCIVVGVNFLTL